jgi:hypothetical protein
MNVKVQNGILKRVQNDNPVMPNQVLNLIQDLRISASHLCFGFDLTLIHLRFITSCELWHLTFLGGKVVSFGIKRSL